MDQSFTCGQGRIPEFRVLQHAGKVKQAWGQNVHGEAAWASRKQQEHWRQRPRLESCLHNLLCDRWDSIKLPELPFTPLWNKIIKIIKLGVSLVVQWLRIRLPMEGARVRALVQENTTCHRAAKPVRHYYWACALEPASHNYWAHAPRARALQQEKPPQWEARAPQWRVAPARRN